MLSIRCILETKRNETNDVIAKKRSDDGALLDEEVLEGGADRIAGTVRLLLLFVPAREPAGDLAGARLVW